jgi:hypothetical protein
MQTFLNIRNGWDPSGTIDPTYEDMWVNSTVITTPNDDAIVSKGTDGLYIAFYGVEGAGAGNDTTATSALSTVPLLAHVMPTDDSGTDLTTILDNLVTHGMITGAKKNEILAGGTGIVAITVLNDPAELANPSDLSLISNDELSLISDFISNNVTDKETKDYSGVTTTIFTVTMNGDDTRKIKIVAVAY